MSKDDGRGATTYQCPECGQVRTGEECRVCNAIERERAREVPEIPWDGNSPMRPPPVVLAFDFQKEQAEKAEGENQRLREAIEALRIRITWKPPYATKPGIFEPETEEDVNAFWNAVRDFFDAALEPPGGDKEGNHGETT